MKMYRNRAPELMCLVSKERAGGCRLSLNRNLEEICRDSSKGRKASYFFLKIPKEKEMVCIPTLNTSSRKEYQNIIGNHIPSIP